MQVLELAAYHPDQIDAIRELKIATRPIPEPGPGQILVKMRGAPVNPSDLLFLRGTYNIVKELPCVPGFEGYGTIVKKGPGFSPWLKVGARVACGGQSQRDGTWAEYYLADATGCLPLSPKVPEEQAPFMLVNPLTALAMLDLAREKKATAIVQSAAASQLGQMLVPAARLQGFELINIVRRPEQVEILRKLGAKHILDSSLPDFKAQLQSLAHQLNATVALDAISGDFTSILVEAMPDRSEIILYGTLGGNYMNHIYSRALSFHMKTLSGFNLKNWSENKSMLKKVSLFRKAQKLFADGTVSTEIRDTVDFQGAVQAIENYARNMTGGKVVIKM